MNLMWLVCAGLKNLCMENPGKNINPVGTVAKGRYMQMHQLEIGKCPMSHCFRASDGCNISMMHIFIYLSSITIYYSYYMIYA